MRFLFTLLLSLSTSYALAADLTSDGVKNWLSHGPELQQWLDQQEDKLPEAPELSDQYDMSLALQQGIAQLKAAGIYNELDQKVKAAGYQSVEHWVTTSQQISLAYLAVTLEGQIGQREEIAEQMRQLASVNMPKENKAMMENMLKGSLALLNAIDVVTAADKAAVRPYLEQLSNLVGDD